MIQHLACIMDGNRRWAQQQGLLPWYGHKEGIEATIKVIDFALRKGIPFLSLYLFALQNFKRSPIEINELFQMITTYADQMIQLCIDRSVKILFIGDRTVIDTQLVKTLEHIETQTNKATQLQLNLFFCYGGQEELIDTCKKIAIAVESKKISASDISRELFETHLSTNGIPSPDCIIRSGGMHRLSNFLLYQAAYAELYFSSVLWPEINEEELEKAYDYFIHCKRNFGS